METRDLDRIRFVTRHFHALQGLQYLVPIGLITLSAAGLAESPTPALLFVQVVLFLGAFVLMLGARRYYRNAFGEVERRPVRSASLSLSIFSPAGTPWRAGSRQEIPVEDRLVIITGLALAALVVFQFLFWPPWIKLDSVVIAEPSGIFVPTSSSAVGAIPAPFLSALCGAFFLAVWLARQRRLSQSYHLALGILLLGLSALLPVAARFGVTLLLCGSAMVLAGLLDHRQLVRALGRHQ